MAKNGDVILFYHSLTMTDQIFGLSAQFVSSRLTHLPVALQPDDAPLAYPLPAPILGG